MIQFQSVPNTPRKRRACAEFSFRSSLMHDCMRCKEDLSVSFLRDRDPTPRLRRNILLATFEHRKERIFRPVSSIAIQSARKSNLCSILAFSRERTPCFSDTTRVSSDSPFQERHGTSPARTLLFFRGFLRATFARLRGLFQDLRSCTFVPSQRLETCRNISDTFPYTSYLLSGASGSLYKSCYNYNMKYPATLAGGSL
jgi:hypothetical protein